MGIKNAQARFAHAYRAAKTPFLIELCSLQRRQQLLQLRALPCGRMRSPSHHRAANRQTKQCSPVSSAAIGVSRDAILSLKVLDKRPPTACSLIELTQGRPRRQLYSPLQAPDE
jgi:hypothetical protein